MSDQISEAIRGFLTPNNFKKVEDYKVWKNRPGAFKYDLTDEEFKTLLEESNRKNRGENSSQKENVEYLLGFYKQQVFNLEDDYVEKDRESLLRMFLNRVLSRMGKEDENQYFIDAVESIKNSNNQMNKAYFDKKSKETKDSLLDIVA